VAVDKLHLVDHLDKEDVVHLVVVGRDVVVVGVVREVGHGLWWMGVVVGLVAVDDDVVLVGKKVVRRVVQRCVVDHVVVCVGFHLLCHPVVHAVKTVVGWLRRRFRRRSVVR